MRMPIPASASDEAAPASEAAAGRPATALGIVWEGVRRNRNAQVGLSIVALMVFCALFAPSIAPFDPLQIDRSSRLQPPSWEHPFGMDFFGRDVLSRVLYGARVSLLVGVIAVGIAAAGGILVGGVAGFAGGWVDHILMRAVDVLLAFPTILLGLAIVSLLGPSLANLMIAVGVATMPRFARVIRGSVLVARENEYVAAARALGAGEVRLFLRHVLPACLAPLIVVSSLYVANAIISASSLSFLGLGVQPPTPEWGNMLAEGYTYVRLRPHVAVFPGLAISVAVLGFNLIGDGLRDALDPRLRL